MRHRQPGIAAHAPEAMNLDGPERSARFRLALLTSLLALLLAGSLGFEAMRTPVKPQPPRGIPCLLVSSFAEFHEPTASGAEFLTNGDSASQRARATFWYVSGSGRRAFVHRVQVLSGRTRRTSFPVIVMTTDRRAAYDIDSWVQRRTALFTFRQTTKEIQTTVSALRNARILAFGLTPDPAPSKNARRDLAIARLDGSRPDLFVIDRGAGPSTTTLSVYSGESRFRTAIIHRQPIAALYGLDPNAWSLDVGQSGTGKLVIVAFRGAAFSPSGRPEVHVLEEEGGFKNFILHGILTSEVSRSLQFAIGPSLAGPSVYSFVESGGQVHRVKIVSVAAPQQTSPRC